MRKLFKLTCASRVKGGTGAEGGHGSSFSLPFNIRRYIYTYTYIYLYIFIRMYYIYIYIFS